MIVLTETSKYIIDHQACTATRVDGYGAGLVADLPEVYVAALRMDREPIPLLGMSKPVVGEPMSLLLDIRRDGVLTVRTTTVVREVEW